MPCDAGNDEGNDAGDAALQRDRLKGAADHADEEWQGDPPATRIGGSPANDRVAHTGWSIPKGVLLVSRSAKPLLRRPS